MSFWAAERRGFLFAIWLTMFFAALDYAAWWLIGWDATSGKYISTFIAAWCGYSGALHNLRRQGSAG